MLKDNSSSNQSLPDFSFPKHKTINSIINFLEKKLPHFISDMQETIHQEDDISQECCIFLNREARNKQFLFHFQHKYINQRTSSDFSIISAERFASKEPIFVIEAKRLPTPGSGRKHEYVKGKLGGIERFKRGLHAPNLYHSAMIGYVQKETCDYWYTQITLWIQDLITNNIDSTIKWENADLLKFEKKIKNIQKYKAVHSRTNRKTDITLNHYLVQL